jgi:hypothetical protein
MEYWTYVKVEWERHLDNAGVDKYTQKEILALMRKINTLQNMQSKGKSWSSITSSSAFDDAYRLARDVEEFYLPEFNAMMESAGLYSQNTSINVSDFLA